MAINIVGNPTLLLFHQMDCLGGKMNKKETMTLISLAIRDTVEANMVAIVIYVILFVAGVAADMQSLEKARDVILYSVIVFGISVFCRISIPPLKQEHGFEKIKHATELAIVLPIMLISFTLCVSHYLFL